MPIWKAKSNVSSVGPSSEGNIICCFSLTKGLYARNVRLCFLYRPQYTNFLYFDLYLTTAYATHYVVINFCQLSDARKAGHLHTPQCLDNITYGYYKALYTVEVAKQLQNYYLKNALVISPPIGLKNKFKMKREVTS